NHAVGTPETPAIHDDQTVITISSNGPVGTRPYMAPEQWIGTDIDHRTDIWAVGVILFRLVTGKFPYELDGAALMYAVAMPDEPVRSVRSLVPDFHPELSAIIDCCLCKNKADRFATARDLLDALEQLLPHHTVIGGDDRCPYPGLMSFQE